MTFTLHAPQIIWLLLLVVGIALSAALHDKPRQPHNFWVDIVCYAISFGLLYWGGFFG